MTTLINDIAASLYVNPGTFDELKKRECCKGLAEYGVWRIVALLRRKGIVLGHPDERMRTKKSWAKKNLANDYDLDFRTPKQKWIDSLSEFKLSLYKEGLIQYNPKENE